MNATRYQETTLAQSINRADHMLSLSISPSLESQLCFKNLGQLTLATI